MRCTPGMKGLVGTPIGKIVSTPAKFPTFAGRGKDGRFKLSRNTGKGKLVGVVKASEHHDSGDSQAQGASGVQ